MSTPTSTRRGRLRPAYVAALSLAVLGAGCANDPVERGDAPPSTKYDFGPSHVVGSLARMQSCDELLEYFQANAAQYQVGQIAMTGVARNSAQTFGADVAMESAAAPSVGTGSSGAADSAGMAADGFSQVSDELSTGTNNQEVGVDEADMVKTDGRRVVSIRNNEVIVVALGADGTAAVTGRVALDQNLSPQSMFLDGDRVFVLGSSWSNQPRTPMADGMAMDIAHGTSYTTITELSIADDNVRVVANKSVEGDLNDARMVDGTVRVVVASNRQLMMPAAEYPQDAASDEAWQRWNEQTQQLQADYIAATTIDDWLPVDADGTPVTSCADTYLPDEFAGPQTLSVLTFADGVDSMQSTSVVAGSGTVYASPERLYVATSVWANPTTTGAQSDTATAFNPGAQHSDIHMFTTTGTANAAYVASGRIEGSVLNQYSMSDADSTLRVAVTKGNWNDGESGIVTLRANGASLDRVGEVWGLGPGETIQSVRYVGDTAYVVTFRQTDPFYVVDVADAANPTVLGELKVPGFSSYLHPVGAGLVLGVGTDADDQGNTLGSKVSLYNTSDPTNPRELDTWTSSEMEFQVRWDPHSFTWDPQRSVAYIVYNDACFANWERCSYNGDGGVIAMAVRDGQLVEVGRLDHNTTTPIVVPETTTTTTMEATTTTASPATTDAPTSTAPTTTAAPSTTTPAETSPTTGAAASGESTASVVPSRALTEPAPDVALPAPQPMPQPMPIEPDAGWGGPVEWATPITRAFPLGDRVITWSQRGIGVFSADGYVLTGFAAF